MFSVFIRILMLFSLNILCRAILYENDSCLIRGMSGICKNQDNCPQLKKAYDQGKIRNEEIPRCGYSIYKEIICCPIQDIQANITTLKENRTTVITTRMLTETPAEKSCQKTKSRTKDIEIQKKEVGSMVVVGYRHLQRPKVLNRRRRGITINFKILCMGTLIAEKYVLTTAHCVSNSKKQPNALILNSVTLINIKKIYIHPNFNINAPYNDIALIELDIGIETSDNIYPICISKKPTVPLLDSKYFIVSPDRNEPFWNELHRTEFNLLTLEACGNHIRNLSSIGIQNSYICAMNFERDACKGFSGAPLLLQTNQGELYLEGINIRGFDCQGNKPSLFIKVSSYLDFIENIVWPENKNIN